MNLTERAILDAEEITSNGNDWGVSAIFNSTNGETATVNVIHVKHNTGFDLDGIRVNSKKATITVSEIMLANLGYTTRNSHSEATLKGHSVTIPDSTGISKNYIVSENYPDEKLGLIVLILVDSE